MPRGDRTGPNGMGPMTGRAAGYCAGNQNPGFMSFYGGGRGFGQGFGRGSGRGFRRGGGYFPPHSTYPIQHPAPENEAEFLKQQASVLEQDLKEIKERLEAIEKSQKK